ncbi:plasmid pRiA4b ORF-3 family protein [Thermosynechococcaceae cyanobacterium BACA0444]|uniref:Plasmid pRiA4b ORF-3 family protein n=1 Tax=Pseudocalidococcus azoricus BACA0444 TaxID=2918990 RepID=A0AAE4FTS5_9CYAN|nr:plasmid pRiA4b ORF-3 family protein [Pseudocalidococcus azoricus]MDS3862234.1 plasmid pRiA4b ORF-3 family protein [Pseudocalidococcus azoricus BACA0444]
MPKATSDIYQLKITIRDSKPPIWRRVQVKSSITLPKLHQLIQAIMAWEDYHLHHFMVGDRRSRDGGHIYFYQPPALFDDDFLKDDELNTFLDEGKFKLNQLLKAEKETIIYEYDFGDSWEHLITLEKILPPAPMPHPICIKAVRACPPEDCGGIWGYMGMLEVLKDTNHPEHKDIVEWLGGPGFDPVFVDLAAINSALKSIKT